jgi:hypothetical protein
MTPQEKCVSLETAKRLRDSKFPQDTERCYLHDGVFLGRGEVTDALLGTVMAFAAPDAQEIGELLPYEIADAHRKYYLVVELCVEDDATRLWKVRYATVSGGVIYGGVHFDKNLAEAFSAAWLWLKEQNLI